MMIDTQLKIIYFKDELKKNPEDKASQYMLAFNREKLKKMKEEL